MTAMSAEYTSVESVRGSTGRSYEQWYELLDNAGARDLSHQEIARLLAGQGIESGWWCQSITGSYERYIGRRVEGQTCDGDFKTSASKTVDATLDEVLQSWCAQVDGQAEFNGVPVVGVPSVATTGRWRYWRAKLADGGRITVSITAAPSGKTSFGLSHDKLGSVADVESWKTYWRKLVKDAL
jgi:hypothetical protein